IVHPWRVERVEREGEGLVVVSTGGERVRARRVVLATGGRRLPKTGSDGHGYTNARPLGHSLTSRLVRALGPRTLPGGFVLGGLSGVTAPTTVEVRGATGERLAAFTNSTLLTHFGLSGPGVLDISRYYLDAAAGARERGEAPPRLVLSFL